MSVSTEEIVFVDNDGKRGVTTIPEPLLPLNDEREKKYIGVRKLDQPPWWVKIGEVQFVFSTYEEAYSKLLNSLGDVGLLTLDIT